MRAIVAGAGETGRLVAHELSVARHDVVLIDRNPDALRSAEEQLDVLTLVGDCTHRSVLALAEVASAGAFVSVTHDTGANVLGAALARAAGCALAVARVDEPAFLSHRRGIESGLLGIDFLLCPAYLTVGELLRGLIARSCSGVISVSNGAIHVATIAITSASPAYERPATAVQADGVVVAGVVRDRELRAPADVSRLDPDDQLLVIGPASALSPALLRLTGQRHRRVLVVGAGDTGSQLAQLLAMGGDRVSLLDSDEDSCLAASERLPDVKVLHGDGTNVRFLRDLQMESVDAVVAVTGEDEVNLMVSLLARQMGVAHTLIEVHRPGYADLYRQLGVSGVVGSYEVVSRATTEAIARKRVTLRGVLPETAVAVVETIVRVESPVPLGRLALPPGVSPIAVLRDNTLLPHTPATPLTTGDVLVLTAPQRSIEGLAKALSGLEP